jgi:sensor histidine kinase regulating citrate/malate metabolism
MIVFILQMTGQVALAQNFFAYEVVISATLLIVVILMIDELLRHKNPAAQRFVIPTFVIIFFALLSFLNYEIRFVESIIIIFQIGAFVYAVQLSLIAVKYVGDATKVLSEKAITDMRLESMTRQIALQRARYDRLVHNSEQIRAMRHDLRHQLTVLGGLSEAGDFDDLKRYIQELTAGIPHVVADIYCENYAVNAVAGYYIDLAQSENVNVEYKFDIPEETGRVLAVDLCIIVGNLLDNAIDALRRLEQGEKYVKIRAKVVRNTLSIIVENNYDGIYNKRSHVYISRKPEAKNRDGIGLSSVIEVCERYDGIVRIENEDKIWRVSTMVNLSAS